LSSKWKDLSEAQQQARLVLFRTESEKLGLKLLSQKQRDALEGWCDKLTVGDSRCELTHNAMGQHELQSRQPSVDVDLAEALGLGDSDEMHN